MPSDDRHHPAAVLLFTSSPSVDRHLVRIVASSTECYPDTVDPESEFPSDWRVAGTGKGSTPRQREFGDRIRARRLRLDLSQEALALRSGINRTYIGSLESGERNPSLENIAKLAIALRIDVGDLVRGLQKVKGRS